MIIIGSDYHPVFQQIAYVDTETGELQERRLQHREEAEKFRASKLGFCEFLDIEVAVKFETHRVIIFARIKHNAADWTNVVPFLFLVTNS